MWVQEFEEECMEDVSKRDYEKEVVWRDHVNQSCQLQILSW